MIKALVTDVSRVLLFPKDENYNGSLNALYKEHNSEKDFQFFKYFRLNEELLDCYKNLNINIHILTSDIIQEAPELKPYWDSIISKIFSASKMGVNKASSEAYKKVLSELNLTAKEVIYIDDNSDNLEVAGKVGLITVLYKNNKQVMLEIKKLV